MEEKRKYLEDPCRVSSLPYWKTNCVSVPETMRILHHDDFHKALLAEYSDEPYFRLKHDLRQVEAAVIPEGFALCKASPVVLAEHINSCYGGACMSVDTLRGYMDRAVYCEALWIAVKETDSGKIVASGIAELDREIGEGALEWIQVSEGYRRRGLGSYVVKALLWRMKGMANFVTVSGRLGHPEEPEKLYQKCGFTGNDIWHVLRKLQEETP